ncbi:MAG: toll/interleukin-1 receptor domain-containing protein [Vicinamibacteria bacterium]
MAGKLHPTRDELEWEVVSVAGSSAVVQHGFAGTIRDSNGHPATSFPSDTTAILGPATPAQFDAKQSTLSSWALQLPARVPARFRRGYLTVACLRHFGGLHSREFDARVEVLLNGHVLDGFGLRVKPDGHSDYFHRVRSPGLPLLQPFDSCETIYSWSFLRRHLADTPGQSIQVSLGPAVRWDIDYVGLIVNLDLARHDVFLSHSWRDKAFARRFAHDLQTRGVRVWIDEAEMRYGDSLISKIGTAINSVEFLVVLLSAAAVASPWVQKEVEIAMNQEIDGRRVKVIPCLVEDCDIPPFLRGKLYADLRSDEEYRRNLERLATQVTDFPVGN